MGRSTSSTMQPQGHRRRAAPGGRSPETPDPAQRLTHVMPPCSRSDRCGCRTAGAPSPPPAASPWIGHSSSSACSISRRFAVLPQPEAERGPAHQRIEKEGGHRREQRDEQHTLQDDPDHASTWEIYRRRSRRVQPVAAVRARGLPAASADRRRRPPAGALQLLASAATHSDTTASTPVSELPTEADPHARHALRKAIVGRGRPRAGARRLQQGPRLPASSTPRARRPTWPRRRAPSCPGRPSSFAAVGADISAVLGGSPLVASSAALALTRPVRRRARATPASSPRLVPNGGRGIQASVAAVPADLPRRRPSSGMRPRRLRRRRISPARRPPASGSCSTRWTR